MNLRTLLAAWLMACAPGASAQHVGNPGRPQEVPEPQAELRQIIGELKRLRLDLLRVLIDTREQTIQQLERELQSAQAEGNSLQDQERAQQTEIAEVDERLSQTSDPQERSELEKTRSQLVQVGPKRIESDKQALLARQSELAGMLNYSRQARQYFVTLAAALERELSPAR